jgi:hypothetical protein
MTEHKSLVFRFDDVEVREREFLLIKAAEARRPGNHGCPGRGRTACFAGSNCVFGGACVGGSVEQQALPMAAGLYYRHLARGSGCRGLLVFPSSGAAKASRREGY